MRFIFMLSKLSMLGVHPPHLRVRDKDYAVNAHEDELSRCVIENLTRHGVEVNLVLKPLMSPSAIGGKSKKSVLSVSVARGYHLALGLGLVFL